LKSKLSKAEARTLPTLPPKAIFNTHHPQFVNTRRRGLQQYLRDLVSHPVIATRSYLLRPLGLQLNQHSEPDDDRAPARASTSQSQPQSLEPRNAHLHHQHHAHNAVAHNAVATQQIHSYQATSPMMVKVTAQRKSGLPDDDDEQYMAGAHSEVGSFYEFGVRGNASATSTATATSTSTSAHTIVASTAPESAPSPLAARKFTTALNVPIKASYTAVSVSPATVGKVGKDVSDTQLDSGDTDESAVAAASLSQFSSRTAAHMVPQRPASPNTINTRVSNFADMPSSFAASSSLMYSMLPTHIQASASLLVNPLTQSDQVPKVYTSVVDQLSTTTTTTTTTTATAHGS
jgi:hypothetical protein